jgi:hypothetical protein
MMYLSHCDGRKNNVFRKMGETQIHTEFYEDPLGPYLPPQGTMNILLRRRGDIY